MWTGEALAAINLTISASTERQWQGTSRHKRSFRAPITSLRNGTSPIGTSFMRKLAIIVRAGCCPIRIPIIMTSIRRVAAAG